MMSSFFPDEEQKSQDDLLNCKDRLQSHNDISQFRIQQSTTHLNGMVAPATGLTMERIALNSKHRHELLQPQHLFSSKIQVYWDRRPQVWSLPCSCRRNFVLVRTCELYLRRQHSAGIEHMCASRRPFADSKN